MDSSFLDMLFRCSAKCADEFLEERKEGRKEGGKEGRRNEERKVTMVKAGREATQGSWRKEAGGRHMKKGRE
jgi:hypothetical protein